MDSNEELLAAAEQAAARNWSVVAAHTPSDAGACSCQRTPCPNPGKHPRGSWAQYQRRRPGADQVTLWWEARWPGTNVGIVTGAISGVVVLDVDPGSGGQDSLEELEQKFGKLPHTPTVLTGGGGTHYYFKHPGYEIKSGAAFMPGLDIRADGGFVIIPPSAHSSGRRYEWEASSEPDTVAMAPLSEHVTWLSKQRVTSVAEPVTAAFDLAGAMTSQIPEGERNTRLVQIAGSLFGSGHKQDHVRETLLRLNQFLCQPPMGESEVQEIVASVGKLEARKNQASEAVARVLENDAAAVENLSEADRLAMAHSLWSELGLDGVADWVYLRGGAPEYVIETPDSEMRIGSDILNFVAIRRQIMNQSTALLEQHTARQWEPKAVALRKLVREVHVEPNRSGEQLAAWLRDFLEAKKAYEDTEVLSDRISALKGGALLIKGRLHLRPSRLAMYLRVIGGDNITTAAVRKVMTQAGWEACSVKVGSGDDQTTTSCWREGKPWGSG